MPMTPTPTGEPRHFQVTVEATVLVVVSNVIASSPEEAEQKALAMVKPGNCLDGEIVSRTIYDVADETAEYE